MSLLINGQKGAKGDLFAFAKGFRPHGLRGGGGCWDPGLTGNHPVEAVQLPIEVFLVLFPSPRRLRDLLQGPYTSTP